MNERSHCPYLGLRQNRAIRFASPTGEHRCYVSGEAQDIPVDQRTHCLSINHLSCPLYTGEWSGTTTGAVAAAGAVALPRRGAQRRLGGRDLAFYLMAVGLVLSIIMVWFGIGYLLTLNGTSEAASIADVTPAASQTTAPPTHTASATATQEPTATPTVVSATPLATPGTLTAVLAADGVRLAWQRIASSDVAGYDVFRFDEGTRQRRQLNADRLTATEFLDSQAPQGTKVRYEIEAVARDGRRSLPATITVVTAPPTATPEPTAEPTLAPTPPPIIIEVPIEVPVPVPGPPIYIPVTPQPSAAPPPTSAPATPAPETPEPSQPTQAPPTTAPPTTAPATSVPPTSVPATPVPPPTAPTTAPAPEPTAATQPSTSALPSASALPQPSATAAPSPAPTTAAPSAEPAPSAVATAEATSEANRAPIGKPTLAPLPTDTP